MDVLFFKIRKTVTKYASSLSTVYSRGANWLFLFLLPIFGGFELSGAFLIQWSLAMMLSPLVNLGMIKAYLRFSVELDYDDLNSANHLLMLFHFIVSLIINSTIVNHTLQDTGVSALYLSLFIAMRQGRLNMLGAILTKGKNVEYSLNNIIVSSLQFIVSMSFVLFYKNINIWLQFNIIIFLTQYIYFFSINHLPKKNHLAILYRMLKFSWPYFVSSSIGILSVTFDKLYMAKYYPVDEIGLLGAIQSLSGVIAFIAAPLIVYYEPKCYNCADKDLKSIIIEFIKAGMLFAGLTFLVMSVAGVLMFEQIYAIEFDEIALSFAMYCVAHLLNYPYLALEFVLARVKDSNLVIAPSIVMPLVVILISLLLIPAYGIQGAAISMLAGAAVQTLFSLFLIRRVFIAKGLTN